MRRWPRLQAKFCGLWHTQRQPRQARFASTTQRCLRLQCSQTRCIWRRTVLRQMLLNVFTLKSLPVQQRMPYYVPSWPSISWTKRELVIRRAVGVGLVHASFGFNASLMYTWTNTRKPCDMTTTCFLVLWSMDISTDDCYIIDDSPWHSV